MKNFEQELDTRPEEICASSAWLGEGKEQCNPEMLCAIRCKHTGKTILLFYVNLVQYLFVL